MSGDRLARDRSRTPLAARVAALDWAGTELGPIEGWPEAPRVVLRLVLAAREPTMLLWGPRLRALFNDAFAALPGIPAATLLGAPIAEAADPLWQALRADVEAALAGESVLRADGPPPGADADAVWTWAITPIALGDGDDAPTAGVLIQARAGTPANARRDRAGAAADALERLVAATSPLSALAILLDAAERLAGADAVAHWSGAGRVTSVARDPETGDAVERADEAVVEAVADLSVRAKAQGQTLQETSGRSGGSARLLAVPFGSRECGTIAVAWSRPGALDAAGLATLEALARACGSALVRAQAERRLRESEARFRSMAESSPEATFVLLDGVVVFANDAAAALVRAPGRADLAGLPIETLLADEDLRARTSARIARVVEDGETLPPREQLWQRLDGGLVTLDVVAGPVDWNGRRAVLVVARDVGERKRSEAALAASEARFRESERRLRQTVEHLPQLVWRSRDGGDWTWSSKQWETFTGQSRAESLAFGWLEAIHPEDRARVREAWGEASRIGTMEAEHRLRDASGQYRWFQTRARALLDDRGAPLEWFGTSTDVDDLRRLREHHKVLLAELQHRVRNTLAIVRSLARRTADTTDTVADFASHFEGRLNAFARVQAAATRNPIGSLDLEYLVAEELAAGTAREEARVVLEGPPVKLRLKAAQSLSLAIHELATNAVKFGAFAHPAGRLSVSWQVEDRAGEPPLLTIVWRETGVPIDVAAPRRQGFGSELLQRSLPYELQARVGLEFEPDGVHCTIALPLGERV